MIVLTIPHSSSSPPFEKSRLTEPIGGRFERSIEGVEGPDIVVVTGLFVGTVLDGGTTDVPEALADSETDGDDGEVLKAFETVD
jgi:hypothetical protein